ncbi:MAG: collagen binding domain-containing protein [Anaerolineae bacterium]
MFIALLLGLSAGVQGGPARAQEPKGEQQYIELNSLSASPKEPEVENEQLSSKEGFQTGVTSAGYLRILSLDGFSGRPMPGHTFHVYDRDNEVVAEVTSDCTGAVQLDDLPTGYYNVQAQYSDSDVYRAYGGSYSQWMFVGAGRRATIRFYSYPMIQLAGIRVYAYDLYTSYYAEGIPFTVYDYGGTEVFSDVTNCSGFVDFFEVQPGWYRVAAGASQAVDETPTPTTATPAAPPAPGAGLSSHYNSGENWVLVYPGYLVAVDFYVDPADYAQGTTTPEAGGTATATPEGGTPAPTSGAPSSTPTTAAPTNTPAPTATPTPTEASGPPPPPPPP